MVLLLGIFLDALRKLRPDKTVREGFEHHVVGVNVVKIIGKKLSRGVHVV